MAVSRGCKTSWGKVSLVHGIVLRPSRRRVANESSVECRGCIQASGAFASSALLNRPEGTLSPNLSSVSSLALRPPAVTSSGNHPAGGSARVERAPPPMLLIREAWRRLRPVFDERASLRPRVVYLLAHPAPASDSSVGEVESGWKPCRPTSPPSSPPASGLECREGIVSLNGAPNALGWFCGPDGLGQTVWARRSGPDQKKTAVI